MSSGTGDRPVSHPAYVPVAVKLVTALSRCAPPSASRYFANTPSICDGSLPLATMNSSESGLSTGSPYWIDMFGTFCGTDVFEWHVKQLTRFVLPKKLRLMVFTMPTMKRAFWIIGVSMANAATLPSRICGEWQPVQSFAVAAANIPIVSMNSSTGMPLRTRMSLKNVSDICGALSAGACGAAGVAAWRAATAMLAAKTSVAVPRSAAYLRLFTAAVAVVVPEVHLRAVRPRPRHHVAAVRSVTRRRDHGRVGLADREDARRRDAVRLVGAGAAALQHPRLDLAGLLVLDVEIPAHVRVGPLHARQHAGNRLRRVLVELRLARVMRERRDGGCNQRRGDDRREEPAHVNQPLSRLTIGRVSMMH